jgi:ArsR family transcriptional regulator
MIITTAAMEYLTDASKTLKKQKSENLTEFLKIIHYNESQVEFEAEFKEFIVQYSDDSILNQEIKKYKALANKTRILLYKLLEKQEMCTCALANILGVTEGTISYHLGVLNDAKLIEGHTSSYFTIWNIVKQSK